MCTQNLLKNMGRVSTAYHYSDYGQGQVIMMTKMSHPTGRSLNHKLQLVLKRNGVIKDALTGATKVII